MSFITKRRIIRLIQIIILVDALAILLIFISMFRNDPPPKVIAKIDTLSKTEKPKPTQPTIKQNANIITDIERRFIAQGLVDVQALDSTIHVDIKYASEDNFMGINVYDENFNKAYLQPEVAHKLVKAQRLLKAEDPALSLIVFDAARPQSVQFKMWEVLAGTGKQHYVASPWAGSMHNFGCSVDLSIINTQTNELIDMGTAFDEFHPKAQPRYEHKYLASGELSPEQYQNRLLLRKVMMNAGFYVILLEWWHFEGFSVEYIRSRYKIIP